MSAVWHFDPALRGMPEETAFGHLDAAFSVHGEQVTQDSIGRVLRVTIESHRYYVKQYRGNGKNLKKRWFGLRGLIAPLRIVTEYQNLLAFQAWGIPTANLVAYGYERKFGFFSRGVLVTREIPEATDLAKLAGNCTPLSTHRVWFRSVIAQVAGIARTLHTHGFVHNDLKWRNLLVSDGASPKVHLIDCPSGRIWWGPFLQYRIIKDLACLDKVAKYHLSRTQRLRFYLDYLQQPRLRPEDKRNLRKILAFFEGRE